MHVCFVQLKDHQFYIGYTTDFSRRMSEHEQGKSKVPHR
ncbi:MAG: GIY-YIG nuclease family protein [Bacteroidetes bacterium]|nr:GIY-YIG nuclease family protein [Bacteroidota bacterium]